MAGERLEIILALRDQMTRGLRAAEAQLRNIQQVAGSVSGAVLNLQNGLAGLGAGLVIRDVVNTFADFDDQMRSVGAVSGATAQEMAQMTAVAKEMGSSTRYSASQSAEALQAMAMAGMSAAESTAALPGVLQMAAANAMDLGEAADIATNVLAGMGLAVEDLTRVNDVLTKAATSANTNVSQLGEAMKIAGPAAKGAGQDLESVVSVLGGLANNGIRGAEGGHAVKRMLLELSNPSAEAAAALQRLNVSTVDSSGNFRGLIPILKDLGATQMDLTDSAAIFGRYTATSGIAAAGAAKDIDELKQSMDGLEEGFAGGIAEDMEAGLGGALRSLKSAAEGVKIALGGAFEADLTEIVNYAKDQLGLLLESIQRLQADGTLAEWGDRAVETFKRIVQNMKDLVGTVKAAAAPFAPLLSILAEYSPQLIAMTASLTAGALVVEKFAGVLSGAVGAFNMMQAAMAGSTILAYIKHVQTASTYTNLLKVATASVGNALTVLGGIGASAFVGWQIGKLINDLKILEGGTKSVGTAVQEMYARIGGNSDLVAAIKNAGELIKKFEQFKNFKLPEDFSGGTSEELREINTSLKKAEVYWEGYRSQQEQIRDLAVMRGEKEAAAAASAEIAKAEGKLADLVTQQERLNEAVQTSGSGSGGAQLEAIRKVIEATKQAAQERIEAEKKAAQERLAAVEESLKQEAISVKEAEAEKQKIRQASNEAIQKIRLESAAGIAEVGQAEIEAIRASAAEQQAIIEEKYAAGLITAEQAKAEEKALIESANADIAAAEKAHVEALENEKQAIRQDAISDYLSTIEEQNKAAEAALKARTSAIAAAEAEGLMTAREAATQKLEIEKDFYGKRLDAAKENLQRVIETYGMESEEYAKSKQIVLEAEEAFNKARAEGAKEIAKAQADAEKERVDIVKAAQEEVQAILSAETDMRAAELEKQISEIESLEQRGVISAQEAADQKKQAELDFLEFKVSQTEAAIQSVIAQYGKDSAEYKKAVADKMSAEADLTAARTAAAAEATEAHAAETKKQKENVKGLAGYSRKVLSEPIKINLDTSPAESALEALRKDYMSKIATMQAQAAKAAASEYSPGYEWMQKQTVDQSLQKADEYRHQMEKATGFLENQIDKTSSAYGNAKDSVLRDIGDMAERAEEGTEVRVDTEQAEANIDRLSGKLGQLSSKAQSSMNFAGGSKYAAGGRVPGSGHGDTVPAWLTPGEFVNPVASVRHYGLGIFEALRRRMIPKDVLERIMAGARGYAAGGVVSRVNSALASIPRRYAAGGAVAPPTAAGPMARFDLSLGGSTLSGAAPAADIDSFARAVRRARMMGER